MFDRVRKLGLFLAVAALLLPAVASANLLQSPHFRLDPNVADTFGGSSSSTSYGLTDAGGEAVVGAGSSGSYKLGQGYVRQLPQSIQLTVLPNSTYAYWPFDTGSGTQAYDGGINSDDATLINAPTWATGIIGNAVTLDGSTQYVASSKSVVGPSTFTTEIWFKSTSLTGGYLMGFGDASNGASTNLDRLIYLNNAGNITFGTKPSSIKSVTTTQSYNDGSWHNVAATLGASGLLLYVDGVLSGSDPTTTTAGSYSGYWRMGYDTLTGWPSAPTSNFLAGTIDEARVLTRALSASEIKNDYTAGANALQNAFTLPNITPGQSQIYNTDAIVRTGAGGYDLYIQRPKPLTHTDGSTTIPDISGTISSPTAWVEGTTKGFGMSVIAGSGVEGKWGTNPNYDYGALTSTPSIYHSRTGLSGGAAETTTIQYRADTTPVQKQGTYTTTVIYTATIRP